MVVVVGAHPGALVIIVVVTIVRLPLKVFVVVTVDIIALVGETMLVTEVVTMFAEAAVETTSKSRIRKACRAPVRLSDF